MQKEFGGKEDKQKRGRGGQKVPAPNHTTFTGPVFITRTLSSTVFPFNKINGKI